MITMSSDSDPYIDENFLGRMVTTPGFLDHVDAQEPTMDLDLGLTTKTAHDPSPSALPSPTNSTVTLDQATISGSLSIASTYDA